MISVWKIFVHAVPSACRPSGGACWLWFVCQWSCCRWTQTHSRRQTTLRHVARPRWRKSSIWWRRLRQTFSRTSTRSRRDSRQTAGVPARSQQPSTRPVRLVLSCLDNNCQTPDGVSRQRDRVAHASNVPVGCCSEQVTLWRSPVNCCRLGLPTIPVSIILGKKEFLCLVVDAEICWYTNQSWFWFWTTTDPLLTESGPSYLCTPWVSRTRHQTLVHNFTKYYSIFIFFSDGVGSKSAINSCSKIPPRLKRVATLLCEISLSVKMASIWNMY